MNYLKLSMRLKKPMIWIGQEYLLHTDIMGPISDFAHMAKDVSSVIKIGGM